LPLLSNEETPHKSCSIKTDFRCQTNFNFNNANKDFWNDPKAAHPKRVGWNIGTAKKL